MAKRSATKTLTERFAMNREGIVVDVEKGTIAGVRLCGGVSANGREYPIGVFRTAVTKYEGRKSYYDHGAGRDREFRSLAARVIDVRIDGDGFPRGTLEVFKSDPLAAKLFEVAQKAPETIGLSHVAECKTTRRNGVEVIESIDEIHSVDIVMDPATNPKGLAESKGTAMTTFKKLIESLIPKLGTSDKMVAAKRLLEMDGVPADMPMEEPAADEPADDSLASALKTLVASLVDQYVSGDLSPEDVGGKVTAYLKAHAGDVPTDGEGEGEGEAEESTKKKSKVDPIREAIAVAAKIGFRADETELDIIAATPEPRRESVAKMLKLNAEGVTGAPQSGARDGLTTTKPIQESKMPSDLAKVEW